MTKTTRAPETTAAVFLLLFAAAMFSTTGRTSAEEKATLNGKPLSHWLKQLRHRNRGRQVRAARALAKAPKELQPQLVPKLIPLLSSARENDRFAAAQVLGEYGPTARPAVPHLLPLLKGTQFERNRAAAAKALGQILKDAKPSKEVEEATAALIAAFHDRYSDVRREAVKACGMIGPQAKACIPLLPPRLREGRHWGYAGDEGYQVRAAAAWTCARMGKLAACHIDLLISMLHGDGKVNPYVLTAIKAIGPVNENIVPNIVDFMESAGRPQDYISRKVQAMGVLESFGPKALKALSFLLRILRETPNNRVPIEPLIAATKAIGAMGPAAKAAVPLLKKMTTYQSHPFAKIPQSKHDELHREAKKALALVLGKSAEQKHGTPKKAGKEATNHSLP